MGVPRERTRPLVPFTVVVIVLHMFNAMPAAAQRLDMDRLETMKPRSIGPAGMSGRITAIAVVRNDPRVLYLGSASGGLWKSTSAGLRWEPVFDTMGVASIGALAIDPNAADVIWVGTGEGNPRNSHNCGDGVYRSPDGGRSWVHLGLENSRNIHRIVLDPRNPDVAYAAVLGSAWAPTEERGVFKTTDGGSSWRKALFVNDTTGCAELVMDPSNPNKLFAAMWQYRRWPWFFKSGGPGSGLFVSLDGGATWKKRTDKEGFPKGELGRIGVAIAPSNPNRVFALVESMKNALYRSDDGGITWKKIADSNIGNRPFYYGEIHADPVNDNRLYNLFSEVTMSEDGGKTFETLIGWSSIHGDHHAFYVHPDDPNFMINGNDGGAAISRDRGKTWRFIENLPLGQFYHISVDTATPYHVYGGLQDNGSWRGPAYTYRWSGISNNEWDMVLFGDGFDVIADRSNNRYCYAMSQGGYLSRTDVLTGESRVARPVHPRNVPLRFNWNAGLAADPFSATTIYYGSQFLHKSTDRGESWAIISPDLTTNDTTKQRQIESGGLTFDVTTAENHCTIIAIEPSSVREGVLWVGTDDGNVQLTTDGGGTWSNVGQSIAGVPDSTWVPEIRASASNAGEALVVFDNHRRNDWTPYVFRTADFGKSWSRLVDGKSVRGFVHSIIQDPAEPRLMFLGTEFGLYVSIDAGLTWTKWKHGLPTLPVTDFAIQTRENDLVIGTFGRSVYILDDLTPLREIARKGGDLLSVPLHLFTPPDALLVKLGPPSNGIIFSGDAAYAGQNRAYGARLAFIATPPDTGKAGTAKKDEKNSKRDSVKTPPDTVQVHIRNSDGDTVRTFKVGVKKGFNTTNWGLDEKVERMPSRPKPEPGAPEPSGIDALPGTYTVLMTYGKLVDSAKVHVNFDPRLPYTPAEVLANTNNLRALQKRIRTATEAADRLREAQRAMEQIAGVIKERTDSTAKRVKDLNTALQDSIKKLNEMIVDREVQGIRSDPRVLENQLNQTVWYAGSSWYAPGPSQQIVAAQMVEKLKEVAAAINRFFERDWPKYREAVDAAKISFFKPYEPLDVRE
jgi:photosystem II stability/assembly factor-like uncharacterized protein